LRIELKKKNELKKKKEWVQIFITKKKDSKKEKEKKKKTEVGVWENPFFNRKKGKRGGDFFGFLKGKKKRYRPSLKGGGGLSYINL